MSFGVLSRPLPDFEIHAGTVAAPVTATTCRYVFDAQPDLARGPARHGGSQPAEGTRCLIVVVGGSLDSAWVLPFGAAGVEWPFVTDPAAVRPTTDLPVVWVTVSEPTNAANGDVWIDSQTATQRLRLYGRFLERWHLGGEFGTAPQDPFPNPARSVWADTLFSPVELEGCTLWLDGDMRWLADDALMGDGVATVSWADKSGLGHHALQVSTRPAFRKNMCGGRGGIYFAGAANRLQTASAEFVGADGTWTAFTVANPRLRGTRMNLVDSDESGVLRLAQFIVHNSSDEAEAVGFNSTPSTAFIAEAAVAERHFNIYEAVRTATAVTAALNGVDGTPVDTSADTPTTGASAVMIAARMGNSAAYTGELCEVILYNRALTDDERDQVRGYLARKWGLSSTVTDPTAAEAQVLATLVALPNPVYNRSRMSTPHVGNVADVLCTDDTVQYAVWYEGTRVPHIGKRTHGSDTWATFDLSTIAGNPLASPSALDSHRAFAIGVDSDGYVHVVGNQHNDALRYVRSTSPGDITAWDAPGMVGTDETEVTYPRFVRGADGTLHFFHRSGTSGSGDLFHTIYDPVTETWGNRTKVVDGISDARSAYPGRIAVDPVTGDLHTFWCWRGSGSVYTNVHLVYARYDGTDWYNPNGDVFTLPIRQPSGGRVLTIWSHSGLINSFGVGVDSSGYPHCAYVRDDDDGFQQIAYTWQDAAGWHTKTLTSTAIIASYESAGEPKWPIAFPEVVVDSRDRVWVVMRVDEGQRGGKIIAMNAATGQEQVLLRLASPEQFFCIDYNAATDRNELHFLVAFASSSDPDADAVPAAVATVDLDILG